MRIALLSDIHANLTALEAVLGDALNHGVDSGAWVTGDIVGYGPDPNECTEAVAAEGQKVVAGNHDLAAVGRIGTEEFNPYAAAAATWTSKQLDEKARSYLAGLPTREENAPFTLVHGSPRDPVWEYLLTVEAAYANLDHFSTPGCVVGHSHLQFFFAVSERGVPPAPTPVNEPVELPAADRFFVNPGSIGQPRDGDPRAAYAILDWERGTVTFRRVPYDIASTQGRMMDAGLPRPLVERLSFGR